MTGRDYNEVNFHVYLVLFYGIIVSAIVRIVIKYEEEIKNYGSL